MPPKPKRKGLPATLNYQKPQEAGTLTPSRQLGSSRSKWKRKEQAATPSSASDSSASLPASVSSASGSLNVSGARSANSDASGGSGSHAGGCESSSTTAQSKRKKPQLDRPSGIKLPKSMQSEMPTKDLQSTFLQFLRSNQVYKSQLVKDPALVIDFTHLLSENKRLAMIICNEDMEWKGHWMSAALRDFALENGSASGTVNYHFTNKPDRIFPAADLLGSSYPLTTVVTVFKKKKDDILTTTPRARILFLVIMWGILDRLQKGDSWAGGLKLEDLFFIELAGQFYLLILKEPVAKGNASPQEQVLDVNGIWNIFEPFVLMTDGSLPLFFEELKHDLTSATVEEVQEEWFFDYLRYYVGLAPSMARKNLLIGLFDCSVSSRISDQAWFFKDLKDLYYSNPIPGTDWRETVATDDVLAHTYMHKQNELRRKMVFKKPYEVVVRVHESVEGESKVGEHDVEGEPKVEGEPDEIVGLLFNYPDVVTVQRMPPSEEPKEEKLEVDSEKGKQPEEVVLIEDFQNNTRSCIAFSRHSLTHTADHVKASDPDDVELYGAKTLPKFLPFVIKGLLKICKMSSKFRRAWSAYTACVRGQKDTAEGVDH